MGGGLFALFVFSCQVFDFLVLRDDIGIALFAMGQGAIGAILDVPRDILEVSTASGAQGIEWAVAEKAVKELAFLLMAGKKLAIFIFEIRKVVFHYFRLM